MRRWTDRLVVLVFVAVISLPLALTLAGRDGADPVAENRSLAPFPELALRWSSLAGFGSGLGDWFEDHFALRAELVRWHAEVLVRGLHTSASDEVVLGHDGWLFYAGDAGIEDYANERPLPPEALNAWREDILRARERLRAHGVAFVFTIAPDKHAIYPEHVPASVRRIGSLSRADQVYRALDGSDAAVDVRPMLLAGKERERLFHLTDTHWNDRGALIAYQEIIRAVRLQAPAVPPAWTRSDFEPVTRDAAPGDLAGMLGLTRVLREERLALVPTRPRFARVIEPPGALATAEVGRLVTEIPGSQGPRAVVVRDSFTSALVPFLSEHFSRAVYVWQNDLLLDLVEAEHADVVIYEIVGRHLYWFTPSPELISN